MPCNGIAVQTARVGIAIGQRLAQDAALQTQFVAYLKEAGIYGVRLEGDHVLIAGGTLFFRDEEVEVEIQERSTHARNAEQALEAARLFGVELLQADVLEAFRASGAKVWDVQQDSGGTLLFKFEIA